MLAGPTCLLMGGCFFAHATGQDGSIGNLPGMAGREHHLGAAELLMHDAASTLELSCEDCPSSALGQCKLFGGASCLVRLCCSLQVAIPRPTKFHRLHVYMGAFGAATVKPTHLFSNAPWLSEVHVPLSRKRRQEIAEANVDAPVAVKYTDKQGKVKVKGTPALRATQCAAQPLLILQPWVGRSSCRRHASQLHPLEHEGMCAGRVCRPVSKNVAKGVPSSLRRAFAEPRPQEPQHCRAQATLSWR